MQEEFQRDGFAIVRGVFSNEELDGFRLQLDEHVQLVCESAFPGEICYEDEKRPRCIFRLEERSDEFRRLMIDDRLVKAAQAALGGANVVADGVHFIDKVPHTSYEFPYHQDNAYQFWSPPQSVLVTLALDSNTAHNGAIACLRGSHKMETQPHHKSGVRGASLAISSVPNSEQYPEVILCLQPGDIALHHANVVHRTGANRSSGHRRNLGFTYHSVHAKRNPTALKQLQQHQDFVNRTYQSE